MIVGPLTFKTKTELANYTRNLLHTLPKGEPLHDQHNFLLALLSRHYDSTVKIGDGVSYFVVKLHKIEKYARWEDGFYAVRRDGSEVSFSYKRCVEAIEPTYDQRLAQAARNVIAQTMFDYRTVNFPQDGCCQSCGKDISFKDSETDHMSPTFKEILKAWNRQPELYSGKAGSVFKPEDSTLLQAHHDSLAKLRVICRACNQRNGK